MKGYRYLFTLILIPSIAIVFISFVNAEEEIRVGRYAKTNTASLVDMNLSPQKIAIPQPLMVVKSLRFPVHVTDIHAAVKHLLRATGYTLDLEPDIADILINLELPSVHRRVDRMPIYYAIKKVIGSAWSLQIDERMRYVKVVTKGRNIDKEGALFGRVVADKQNIGHLNEAIMSHHEEISFSDLIFELVPKGWEVSFEIPQSKIEQMLVFHAETTRRRALEQLFKQLNLAIAFYPGRGLLLVRPRTR